MPAPDCASLHPGYKLRSSTAYSRGLISTGPGSQDPAIFVWRERQPSKAALPPYVWSGSDVEAGPGFQSRPTVGEM